MGILDTNQQTGNPIFNVGEYQDVLSAEQTLNYENIEKYVKSAVNNGSEADLNAAITNVLKQPIMAGIYRSAGIKPEQVDEYIQSRTALPMSVKTTNIISLSGLYKQAAEDMETEIGTPQISGDREWRGLSNHLKSSASVIVPMKSFIKQKAAESQPQEPKKSGWDKIAGLLRLKKDGRKF